VKRQEERRGEAGKPLLGVMHKREGGNNNNTPGKAKAKGESWCSHSKVERRLIKKGVTELRPFTGRPLAKKGKNQTETRELSKMNRSGGKKRIWHLWVCSKGNNPSV